MPNSTIRAKFVLIWSLLIFSLSLYAQKSDVIRRAFFDIGSGATRMVIADVNIKNPDITIIHEQSEQVAYKLDMETHQKDEFSQEIRDRAILVLARMKWTALEKGATEFLGVATSAFRTAKNGGEFAAFITRVLGIQVIVISQEQESILGFMAAVYKEGKKPQQIVVWDIGGGSMQMTTVDENGQYVIYSGQLASVSFASYIIQNIKGQNIRQVNTPNPITEQNLEEAIKYARSAASQVPIAIRNKFQDPDTVVLGIGGVHYYSIRNQVKADKNYNLGDVRVTLSQRIGKTDEQIGGEYAKTEVSNLALVLAFMEELKIKSVKLKKINMAHGILLHPSSWK